MWETWVWSLDGEDLLEEEMASREVPWIEEPGRLQSLGSQRVGPDRLSTHTQEQRGRAGEIHILPPSPSAPLYQGHLRVGGWLPQPCHPLWDVLVCAKTGCVRITQWRHVGGVKSASAAGLHHGDGQTLHIRVFNFFPQSPSLNAHRHTTGCVPLCFPHSPFGIKCQLSREVTCLITQPLLAAFSPVSLPLDSFTSRIQYLHMDLRVCFWGNPN